ncbi:MAG: class I SAM-dependent methyltransferase [Fibrobacteres bacterium]|nr:class I SAM-dependent methyltransferase [Fibrobacterota bacterium]
MGGLKPGWLRTKYVWNSGRLRASSDEREVGAGSWLIADTVAERYGKVLPDLARGRLVDLGCGKAPLLECYGQHVDSVLLADWANSYHDNPMLDLVCDLNKPLELPSSSFDTIVMSDVLEHIAEPLGLLREIARISAPGAWLIMNVPFMYSLHEEPYDYFRYTRFGLMGLLTTAGFKNVTVEEIGGPLEVVSDVFGKIFARIPFVGRSLVRVQQRLVRTFSRSMGGRFGLAEASRKWPLGYFVTARIYG